MDWEGKTVEQTCEQIKDPPRNGGRSLDDIVHHIGTDHLVGWAWAPGARRVSQLPARKARLARPSTLG